MTSVVQISWGQTALSKTKVTEIQERLRVLEEQQKEIEAWYTEFYILGKKRISPFLSEKIYLGGYFEASAANLSGPDMKTQNSANNQALGLNLSAEYSEKIRFVTQTLTATGVPLLNLHNNPNVTPSKRQYVGFVFGSFVAQGFLEYKAGEFFNIQSGVGYIPFGIAYQQREPVLFHRRGGPQMLVNDDGNDIGIASPLWTGVHIFGQLSASNKLNYNLYSFTPFGNTTKLGVGGRLWSSVNEYITAGLSFQSGERKQSSYLAKGLDIDFRYQNFGLLTEYAMNSRTGPDSVTYYFEPYYKFLEDHWLIYLNFEYLKFPSRVSLGVPDPIEKKYYGFGINWLPLPLVRLRLGLLKHDYIKESDIINGQRRDYVQLEFSTAVAF